MKSAPNLFLLAAAALVVTATTVSCSTEKPGKPNPAPSASQSAAPSSENKEVFADLDSCEMLRDVTRTLAYEGYKPETLESDNGCRATKARYGNVSLYFVGNEGIGKLNPSQGTKTTVQIGGREAVQFSGDGGRGSCYIGIAVTPNARASVTLTLSDGSNEQSCADGMVVAEAVAPKLPRGN
ncbi:DUF3558 family protein [Amycolatopsis oliviviridis]|nr:DUF3558 family protein [Amycolatopsis oliviviridis]